MKKNIKLLGVAAVALALCGCPREVDAPTGKAVSPSPDLPFSELVQFAQGDSQYHVTSDFSLSLDNGSWTSSHPDVVSVDSQGKATVSGYDGGLYSRDVTLTNSRGGSATITVRYPLPDTEGVGYDKLTLHGKFRSYRPDTSKGDSLTHWCTGELLSDGSTCADCSNENRRIPEGTIVDGVEYPTYWSRLPLSIHADNHDTTRGLYAIHAMGTSAIFPNNEQRLSDRADNNMRQCTAGVYIAFETDSATIKLDWELYHQNSEGVTNGRSYTGIDIYTVEDGVATFKQNLNESGQKDQQGSQSYTTNTNNKMTKYILMLPTYNGFEVGVTNNPSGLKVSFSDGATTYEIDPFNEQVQKPILIYGTSITQGDGDNRLRPGGTYAAQIMWATGREVINMGVAGSAQMEYKMADFLSQIESEVFVIDPGWNLTAGGGGGAVNSQTCSANGDEANISNEEVVKRLKYMVTSYRKNHPATPIIVCPNYLKSSDNKTTEWQEEWSMEEPDTFDNSEQYYYGRPGLLLYGAFLELQEEGVTGLYWAEQGVTANNNRYVAGNNLHPAIDGMTDIANFILPAISQAAPHVYSGGELPDVVQ